MAYDPGVFDVIKGAYLSPGAVDKTLPTEVALNRGDLVVESSGKWILATGNLKTATIYAVTTPTDKVAAFAGSAYGAEGTAGSTVGGLGLVNLRTGSTQAPIGTERANAVGSTVVAGNYMVTAVPLNVPGEFRISVASNAGITSGMHLMVNEGKFVDGTSGCKFIATSAQADVYHNNKTVKTDANGAILRQGGPIATVTFKYVA